MEKIIVMTLVALVAAGCQPSASQTEETTSTVQSASHSSSQTDTSEKLSPEEMERMEMLNQLPEEASTDDWNLILVNNWTPIEEELEIPLEEVEPGKSMDERIVEPYTEWMLAAQEAGHSIYFASGYRSVERQTNNYNRSIQNYIAEGYSEEEARELTEDYIAIPARSEHHTGLALDLVDNEWIASGKGLVPEYDTQESQHWLVENMADFGFILRYPEGKEELTDIQYESWHFRYVGEENAHYIVEHDLVLEEYIELLKEREALEAGDKTDSDAQTDSSMEEGDR